jgi:nifR3 family TIM-barrel protein
MLKLGSTEIKGRFSLAPMAGVSDFAFREICSSMGAALTVTEMVSAKALVYKDEKTKSLLYSSGKDMPLACQIFGHEPDVMAEAASLALEISKAQILDINMGCPVGKIVRAGDGSALMNDLPLASSIIKAVKAAVSVPVTVKFRKGPDSGHVNAVEFARMCEASGADMITVHGRTRDMMYDGEPLYDYIRLAKQSVHIPVFANGGIDSEEKAIVMMEKTGADGIMLARYGFENPLMFSKLCGRKSEDTKGSLLLEQLTIAEECYEEQFVLSYIKKLASYFMKKMPGTKQYKQELFRCGSIAELRRLIGNIFRESE